MISIYVYDVQLLFSGTPNNLEQLKAYADKPKDNERLVQWKWSENEQNETECILLETPKFNKRTEIFQLTINSIV